jgi:hypothetical protein
MQRPGHRLLGRLENSLRLSVPALERHPHLAGIATLGPDLRVHQSFSTTATKLTNSRARTK